ncbi:2'-5' RNA ligase [Variovorax paradoxus]|uniref:2'-5' RNA ligase family protein n=1 Tax=Variovorax paradoxus TaxID=34073 RepID=UPI00278CCD8E|nr:2'-5' RNA ligase family protein [Variovorax paradoxus]MDQ0569628.1 2'-5' RNA ligase [Variovorax paradoxus]
MDERTQALAARALVIGLFPDAAVQAAIKAHCAEWWWPRGHYFPPGHRLHLTLHRVEDRGHAIEELLRHALAEVPMRPLELTLDSSCTWRNDISVVQPAEHEGLRALHDDIVRAVRNTGLARPAASTAGWTPHITIARQTERAARPPCLPPIRWRVREFRLIRSHRGNFFYHELLARYPMQR